MTHILLIVLMLLAEDSPLVKAAKANGGAKKAMPKKPITNADVKKSTGKLIEKPADGAPASTPAGPPKPALSGVEGSSAAVHEAQKKALAATQKRVAEAEAKVAELEKELARVEQSYYEASDPNHRDLVIAPRFAQTKKQLDAARADLTAARTALAEVVPKPPPVTVSQ
jgi:hypothetical protein